MISRKKFQYHFINPTNGNYYQVVGGDVTETSEVTPIASDPLGWKDTLLQWIRHTRFHGVFRSYVVPLSFCRDGAHILRSIYYTQGREGKCTLLIKKLNHTTQGYEDYYTGDVDFSQKLIDARTYFQVSLLDSGLAALLQAKDNTVYEIPIMDADSERVLMDGINLRGSAHYVIPEQGVTSPVVVSNTMIIAPVNFEGINEATVSGTMTQLAPAALTFAKSTIYTVKFPETVTISAHLDVFIDWSSLESGDAHFVLVAHVGIPSALIDIPLYTAAPLSPGSNATYHIDIPPTAIPLTAGESIGIFFTMLDASNIVQNSVNSRFKILGNTSVFDISSEYRRPATVVHQYPQRVVWEKLINLIGNGVYAAASNYLNTQGPLYVDYSPYWLMMTSGDAMRGIGDGSGATDAVPAKLQLTLSKFQKDSASRDMTGIGVEGTTARLEHLSYFYDKNTVSYEITEEVRDVQITEAEAFSWNTLKIGYNYMENEALNSKDDPFLTHQYASEGIRDPGEIDLVSPFIASITTAEYARANLSGKKTTGNSVDNSVFLTEVSGSVNANGEHLLSRRQNDAGNSSSGMIAGANGYNYGLTPKRCLYRNSPLIHAGLHLQEGTSLTFQAADQNAEFKSKLSATTGMVIEKSHQPVVTMDAPLLLPKIMQFVTKVDENVPDYLAANPNGLVKFPYRDKHNTLHIVGGFIYKVSVQPSDNEAQTWELIPGPDTNLSIFIR